MPRPLPLLMSVLSLSLTCPAQATPKGDATDTLQRLEQQAAAQHKRILLQFGASWCGNCRLFERFLTAPEIKPIMDKTFVFADLASGERADDTRHSNLPGAQQLERKLGGGERVGYPYLVMLDEHGKVLATSVRPGKAGNIGYPAAPDEVAWFMTMLQQAAPSLSPAERNAVQAYLKAHGS